MAYVTALSGMTYEKAIVNWLNGHKTELPTVWLFEKKTGKEIGYTKLTDWDPETRMITGRTRLNEDVTASLDEVLIIQKQTADGDLYHVPFTYVRRGFIPVYGTPEQAKKKAKATLPALSIDELNACSAYESVTIDLDAPIQDAFFNEVFDDDK